MSSLSDRRVAVVYRLDHPGGVQSCALSLVKGLNRQGIIPDILWDLEPSRALLEKAGVQANFHRLRFPLPTRWIDRMPPTARYLAWIVNAVDGDSLRGRYDFFYIFHNGFLLSPSAPHLRYLSGPPLLPQLEQYRSGLGGVPIRLFRGLYSKWLRFSRPVYEVHRGSRYVINSQFTAGLFAEAYGMQLPVVHPPIDLSGRSFTADDLEQRDSLTFFSRIVPYKRPEMVLDLAERHPELRCVVMGGVPDHRVPYFESLVRRAHERGLEQTVFLSNPSNQRVYEELARTRYYVFPAVNEHFGMATAEAVASGALPFVHDSGGQREIVNDPRLRFQDTQFIERFSEIAGLPAALVNEMRLSLARYVRGFSEDVYIEKMLSYLCN